MKYNIITTSTPRNLEKNKEQQHLSQNKGSIQINAHKVSF